ncbi:MAG: flagellar filament capping protein FliD [Lachnospiraceae bacterium]|nr:flagellar filament capping protein FliD [Lachnospiraceae bacterium]
MAINFSALNTAYNYYLTSYAPKTSTSFDTHKPSELRRVYNSIVKLDKESPLYLLNEKTDYKSFAIGLKENARCFRNTIASLGGLNENELLNKKAAYSSNESLVTAEYIGDASSVDENSTLEIQVRSLAAPQVNMGSFLPSNESVALAAKTYSFDLNINDLNYEFQFAVTESDTNKDIQERLSRLINNAEIGVSAEVLEDEAGNSSLKLSSNQAGLPENKEFLFHISEEHTSMASGAVEYLGIGEVTRNASNAEFTINGIAHTTYSNHFTIEKMYEISLIGLSESKDNVAVIGIKNDIESLKENIHTLIGSYNQFLKAASEYIESQPGSNRLVNEMSHIALVHSDGFDHLGVRISETGALELDEKQLSQAALSEDTNEAFHSIKDFTHSVLKKTSFISLNPMEYADKKIVAYKNPGKNYANPYMTSSYSGMLFNGYC